MHCPSMNLIHCILDPFHRPQLYSLQRILSNQNVGSGMEIVNIQLMIVYINDPYERFTRCQWSYFFLHHQYFSSWPDAGNGNYCNIIITLSIAKLQITTKKHHFHCQIILHTWKLIIVFCTKWKVFQPLTKFFMSHFLTQAKCILCIFMSQSFSWCS